MSYLSTKKKDITNHNNISYKNIRATKYRKFWGTEYDESIYLWEGAKHNLTLSEIEKIKTPTLKDLFATKEEIIKAHEYCKQIYFKFLPFLTIKLNKIHDLDLPESFWRTVFGYWLFRHICIVYEKYSYLSKFDIDTTSIKLLEKNSFYVPNDHFDYLYCFCNDFGVQQLVSHYYYLYKKKEFPYVSKNFNLNPEKKYFRGLLSLIKKNLKETIKIIISRLIEPKIALVNVSYASKIKKQLFIKSKGLIQPVALPQVNASKSQINSSKRQKIIDISTDNDFEFYLTQTFYYCFPKILLEQFRDFYDAFIIDIDNKKFSHIVTESWISNIPTSIYIATAQHKGRKMISPQHGASIQWLNSNLLWIDYLVADTYITTGWKSNRTNIIPGGFSSRKIYSYKVRSWKKNILYISSVKFPYLLEYGEVPTNKNYLKSLKIVRDFINLLPEQLFDKFVLRPRRMPHFWDTEYAWEIKRKNIQIDTGTFSKSVLQSKIVIIDHISTGLAEILLMKVPFIIIHNKDIQPINEKFNDIFNNLIQCGVVHNSAQSAVEHLSAIYDDVQKWWASDSVQRSINELISKFLAPPSKTIDFLLSCLDD